MSLAAIIGIILNLLLPKTKEEIEEQEKTKKIVKTKTVKKTKKA